MVGGPHFCASWGARSLPNPRWVPWATCLTGGPVFSSLSLGNFSFFGVQHPAPSRHTARGSHSWIPPTASRGGAAGGSLDLVVQEGERRVRSRRSLPEGFSWGPFQGSIHSEPASPGHGETVRSNAAAS
uniref:Zinc finger protein ZFPM1/2 PR domain-containing protein n=1 Tax=Bubo bubo TaxID=30461 RepID=A0A8C0EIG0_BUBBB